MSGRPEEAANPRESAEQAADPMENTEQKTDPKESGMEDGTAGQTENMTDHDVQNE